MTHSERWPVEHDLLGGLDSVQAIRSAADSQEWKRALAETGLFTSLSLTERACELDIGVDEFVALVGSWGWISDLPGERRAAVLGAVRELVGSYATVTVRHHTEVCATRTVAG